MSEPYEDPYPVTCPFCSIAKAYDAPAQSGGDTDLAKSVPEDVDVSKVQPSCYLVLSAPRVLAFLDIMPMTRGHLLVVTRSHREKVEHVQAEEGSDVGFWLPILSRAVAKVTGNSDYNVVQNNGIRAAQVVPHVHFHIIPRPESVQQLKSKSWSMFGRGQREDMDEEEGEKLAADLRKQVRKELEAERRIRSSI